MKMKKMWFLFVMCFILFGMWSCSDDDTEFVNTDVDGIYHVPDQLSEDVVKNILNKKICILGSDANYPLLNTFLLKRFPDVSGVLDADTEIVFITEKAASGLLADIANLEILRILWLQNKPIGFIRPAFNSLKLYAALSGKNVAEISDGVLDMYKNLSVLVVKLDGNQFMHEGFSDTYTYQLSMDETDAVTGNTVTTEKTVTAEFTPTDYNWGQMAENVVEWLDRHSVSGSRTSCPAFRTRSAYEEEINYAEVTYRSLVRVDYPAINIEEYGNPPSPRIIYPITRVKIAGAFNMKNENDVYDFNIEQEVPCDSVLVENLVTKTWGVFNYKSKYTGGLYRGADMSISLGISDNIFSFTGDAIDILDPVPIQQASSYNVTHTSGGWTVGGSMQAVYNAAGLGVNAGFSASYTFPQETKTKIIQEMPVIYVREDGTAHWNYDVDYSGIYEQKGATNAKYHPEVIPAAVKASCITSQAAAFRVNDSKKLRDTDVYMNIRAVYKFSSVMSNKDVTRSFKQEHSTYKAIFVPEVYRYFEKYTPALFLLDEDAFADEDSWNDFEKNTLLSNINYKCFKESNLLVGARLEKDVPKTALSIWESAINTLINQYNGRMKPEYEYVVGLVDSKGNYLDTALKVDTAKVWKMIKISDLQKE